MNSLPEHPQDRLADYVAGRLDPQQMRTIAAHLDACEECAEDVLFAQSFRARAVEQGQGEAIASTVHLAEDRLAYLSNRGESPRRDEARHLAACDRCTHELSVMQSIPVPDELLDLVPVARRTLAPARRWWATGSLGAVATAAVVLLLLQPWRTTDLSGVTSLAVVEPMEARFSRGEQEPGSFAALRRDGLVAYSAGDYAGAIVELTRARDLDATDEIRLYLGSALLIAGQNDAAVTELRAASQAEDELLREEGVWQLANAFLAQGDAAQARPLLQRLAGSGSAYGRPANSALEALDAGN